LTFTRKGIKRSEDKNPLKHLKNGQKPTKKCKNAEKAAKSGKINIQKML